MGSTEADRGAAASVFRLGSRPDKRRWRPRSTPRRPRRTAGWFCAAAAPGSAGSPGPLPESDPAGSHSPARRARRRGWRIPPAGVQQSLDVRAGVRPLRLVVDQIELHGVISLEFPGSRHHLTDSIHPVPLPAIVLQVCHIARTHKVRPDTPLPTVRLEQREAGTGRAVVTLESTAGAIRPLADRAIAFTPFRVPGSMPPRDLNVGSSRLAPRALRASEHRQQGKDGGPDASADGARDGSVRERV